jgi:hypothetical protein
MRGQYIRNIIRQLISKEDMFLWLSRGNLKGQTTSDQALQTKYHATKILQTETDSKCRVHKFTSSQFDEAVEHII